MRKEMPLVGCDCVLGRHPQRQGADVDNDAVVDQPLPVLVPLQGREVRFPCIAGDHEASAADEDIVGVAVGRGATQSHGHGRRLEEQLLLQDHLAGRLVEQDPLVLQGPELPQVWLGAAGAVNLQDELRVAEDPLGPHRLPVQDAPTSTRNV